VTSSWFFLSTLNYDARSATHQSVFSLKYCLRGESLAKLVQILPVVGKAIGITYPSVGKELDVPLREPGPLCSPDVHTYSNIATCVEEGLCWMITCVCVKWVCHLLDKAFRPPTAICIRHWDDLRISIG